MSLWSLAAQAQTSAPPETEMLWEFRLDMIDAGLEGGASVSLLKKLRPQLQALAQEVRVLNTEATRGLAPLLERLKSLGPKPDGANVAEDAAVAAQREDLNARIEPLQARIQRTGLIIVRTDQALNEIVLRERQALTAQLFKRGPSPLAWSVLSAIPGQLVTAVAQLVTAPLDEWAPGLANPESTRSALDRGIPGAFLSTLFAILITLPIRRKLLRKFNRENVIAQPTFAQRVIYSLMIAIARGILPALISGAPAAFLMTRDVQFGIAANILIGSLLALCIVLLVSGLSRAVLAPGLSADWRVTPLTDESALKLDRRITLLAVLLGVAVFANYVLARHAEIPTELTIFYDFIRNSLFALAILALLPRGLWQVRERSIPQDEVSETEVTKGVSFGSLLRIMVGLLAIHVPVAALLGYDFLATYLVRNLIVSAVAVGVGALLHGLARDLTALVLRRDGEAAVALRESLGFDDRAGRLTHFWLVAAVDLALFIVIGAVVLNSWGVSWVELTNWLRVAIEGIRIGSFTFAITDLVLAIVIFAATLLLTRALQRLLEQRVFPQTNLDTGMRHSLKTAVGYIGLVVAIAIAISALGLDLSNVAIIAGALSVGIGFGLQNIVNNFVSGLILLIERPIKVGDWVVIGAHQGHVKQINVRATEIQTFNRSSVIIPNSELLSSAVVNWTHKDSFARVDVAVGVAYGSDIEHVRNLLLKVAADHPRVNPWPEPFVLFENFGDSSLDFELRSFISNADQYFRVASDIRFAVDAAFREHGIVIPFPQRDLNIQGLDELARTLRGERDARGQT